MVIIGIIYAILLIILYKTNEQRKIYYNNYRQCLKALSELDPKLAKYLKDKNGR